jgi:Uma2 family endonuclease
MTASARQMPPPPLTFEDYMEEFRTLPPTPQPTEILDGVRYKLPTPPVLHQIILSNMAALIGTNGRSSAQIRTLISPLDQLIRRDPLRVRQPDMSVMSSVRYCDNDVINSPGPITVTPELVIEMLSPSETPRSIQGKIADFRAIGVEECWIVSSKAETIEVLALPAETSRSLATYRRGEQVRSTVFPDVVVGVNAAFDD